MVLFAGFRRVSPQFLANCSWAIAVILSRRANQRRAIAMRPKARRESGQNDLFKARLDQIVDPDHALVRLSGSIDWRFLE
ncbi:hypothetical protein E4K64_38385, partial [Bradyrhizobium frederickii]